jgi:hypothetical protein
MLSLTAMLSLATLLAMKLTENRILVPVIGRGRTEAGQALGHQIILQGRREEARERTADADPGLASVSLDDRRSACVSEMINSLSGSPQSLGLVNRMRKFFLGFATGAEVRSDPATNLSKPRTSSLSSVTTPSGPWVYTVVPWED